ncbi:MAG: hypothetical protein IT330_12675 [Anaerolineae bacterium]|nr:hypothetical protein [Anaerolineae bacterium]
MQDMVRFLLFANRLKAVPRFGWALRGVPLPESVAEHTTATLFQHLQARREARRERWGMGDDKKYG